MRGLNVGSGQRPFGVGWCNMDINPRWEPDVVGDWNNLKSEPDWFDYVVSHHSLEHVGCGEGDTFIQEAHRVLKKGGSLLIFVPDMMELARRYVLRQLTTQIYMTNVYGAYMGSEADRHKWGYDRDSLQRYLEAFKLFDKIKMFDWRPIDGADIARDWWILGMEAIK